MSSESEPQYHPDGTTSGAMLEPAVGIISAVVACTAFGLAWDFWVTRRGRSSDKESPAVAHIVPLRGWVVGMLVSSYALLLPGLISHLFVARTDLVLFGAMNLAEYDETMVSLIERLIEDNMVVGALLVSCYAIVIPLFKIVLLVLGQCLQRSGRARSMRWARRCILVVQAISKWASPDMFAYILLMCLMRGLDKPPRLRSGMSMDVGFTSFCVFCLGSTVSSLGIHVPELPSEEQPSQGADVAPKCVGHRAVAAAVALLSALFGWLLLKGLRSPSMSLHIDLPLLFIVKPELAEFKVALQFMKIDELLRDEVSVWASIQSLAHWTMQGEVNSGIALFLYAGCALILPILDMSLLLATTSLQLVTGTTEEGSTWASRAMVLSRQLRKCSMLDVSVMGSMVVVAALRTLREKGVLIEVRSGAFFLLFAEVCHHTAAFIASRSLARASARRVDFRKSGSMATVTTCASSTDSSAGEDCDDSSPGAQTSISEANVSAPSEP